VRRLALLGTLALAAVLPGATSSAAPPDMTVIPVDDTAYAVKASARCGFDILLHTEGTIRITEFTDRTGEPRASLTVYPGLTYTFINQATGKSITSVSPDPEHVTINPDGSFTMRVTGLIMHWVVPGQGVLGADAGPLVMTFDADGELVSELQTGGHHVPRFPALCEILAAP
jgi:hypothetical protein